MPSFLMEFTKCTGQGLWRSRVGLSVRCLGGWCCTRVDGCRRRRLLYTAARYRSHRLGRGFYLLFFLPTDHRLCLSLSFIPPLLVLPPLEETIMANDAPCLPQEIITNIVVRLPVKSLIRFQCVCKDWKNLFRTHLSLQNTSTIPPRKTLYWLSIVLSLNLIIGTYALSIVRCKSLNFRIWTHISLIQK